MKKYLYLIPIVLSACNSGGTSSSNNSFTITSITPSDNTTIPTNQSFKATFSNSLNTATLNNNVNFESTGGVTPAVCTGNSNTATCTPSTNLAYGTKYSLVFNSGIQNPAGNNLSKTTFQYTTFAASQIESITPLPSTTISLSPTFVIKFSESMNTTTLNNTLTPGNVTLTNNSANPTPLDYPLTCTSSDSYTMNCSPNNNLNESNSYTLSLTNKILTANGVPLTPTSFNYQTTHSIYTWFSAQGISGTYLSTTTTGKVYSYNAFTLGFINLYYQNNSNYFVSYPNPTSSYPYYSNVVYGLDGNVYLSNIQAPILYVNNNGTLESTNFTNSLPLNSYNLAKISEQLTNQNLAFIFKNQNSPFDSIAYLYTPSTKSLTNITQNLINPSQLVINGTDIYANAVNGIFEMVNNAWVQLGNNSSCGTNQQLVYSNGQLLITDATAGICYFNSSNTWINVSTPTLFTASSAYYYNDNIFVTGTNGQYPNSTPSVYRYNLIDKNWYLIGTNIGTGTSSYRIAGNNSTLYITSNTLSNSGQIYQGSPL